MTPETIYAALAAYSVLEPEVQKAIAGLIHLLHKKPPSAEEYLAEARALLARQPAG